jgi:hypothetical protein
MMSRILPVIVDKEGTGDDAVVIRSPALGLYSLHPEPRSCIVGGGFAGRLTILNRAYDLVLPSDTWGQVGSVAVGDKVTPVDYGQVLFHLRQWGIDRPVGKAEGGGVAAAGAAAEGVYPILSPTDGILYLRPSPQAEPYVRVGCRVGEGHTLALVEVMKCFNPIQYGGPGFPPEAEIVDVWVQDGAEIKAEQVLFLVR